MLFLLFHCWFLRFILLNFFWRTCQMSQSLFFFTFRHKTKKKQQTKQSFRNRKKPLCIEKKRKRLRTKVNKINFNSNFFFFNNSFFYFENKYVVSSLGFGVAQTSRTTNSLVFFSMMKKFGLRFSFKTQFLRTTLPLETKILKR